MRFKLKWQLLILLVPVLAVAGPRSVNLEKEMEDAKLVAPVKILSYGKGVMKFSIISKPKHPLSARFASSKSTEAMEFLNQKELDSVTSTAPMTSAWPAVGTEVLIVVNERFFVSLFAARKGSSYRFWSPWETDDIPIFKCEEPARGLPTEHHDNKRHFSDEGCLFPIKLLKQKL